MADFHPVLANGVTALGLDGRLPQLERSAVFSRDLVEAARTKLTTEVVPEGIPIDVVALGSVARQEASDTSDFDYLVVVHELAAPDEVGRTRELLAAVAEFMRTARLGQPGDTGTFGQVVSAPEFIERIGLQHDTNVTHTHRMLLLEESVSVYQPLLQKKLVEAIVTRYLADYEVPKPGVPRFLLNDVERYWRTLCVDYQAKRWGLPQPHGWGLRYLKLIISRKLAFVGTITSLLLCKEATTPYFIEQFEMPPLARFIQLHDHVDEAEREALRKALLIAEEFATELADQDFRDEAKKVSRRSDIKEGTRFSAMQQRARTLQEHLEVIFYGDRLAPLSKRYLSF